MKKTILIAFAISPFLTVLGQKKTEESLPFVLLIDNEVPDPSSAGGLFLIKDSIGVVKDSIKFDYWVGRLQMTKPEYDKLFSIQQVYKIFIKFKQIDLKSDTTYIYEKQILNEYINKEYPNGFINKAYFIFKIFNKFNVDNRSKYYFKKDENYIVQITIPGLSTLITYLK